MSNMQNGFLIRNARTIGFGAGVRDGRVIDIRVDPAGLVEEFGESRGESRADASAAARIIDVAGNYISPGWMDIHAHVFEAVRAGTDPENVGPKTGVTCVVDAGSAGEASFEGFRRYVIDKARFPIYAFLNIGSAGVGHYTNDSINLLRTYERVTANGDRIRGIKVLASRRYIGDEWVLPVVAAKRIAVDLGVPVMAHIAEPPVYIEEVVDLLGPGDIITHCFHGKIGNSIRFGEDRVSALYRRALENGVSLDVAHGAASFSIESAQRAIAGGIKPSIISTDLHSGNLGGPVGSLSAVMSKMIACGLTVEEVVEKVTLSPARALDLSRGTLEVGEPADFTIFAVDSGDFTFYDAGAPDDNTSGSAPLFQKSFPGESIIRPLFAVFRGIVETVRDLDLTGGR